LQVIMNGFLIGRFQPFHLGHLEAVNFALSKVDQLYIGIGSSNKSNELRNPFTADERNQMIKSSLEEIIMKRVSLYNIPDVDDHSKWTESIDKIIPKYDIVFSNDDFTHRLYEENTKKIISVALKSREDLSGTNIRRLIQNDGNWKDLVPNGTKNILLKIDAKNRLKDL
ncbi:MAG: nicotinamide-nucleotide adenylyltransferase, partial [Thermoproteota archaeon]|nr:nicotinamide-nucleotide adenylyltransferase [Thermoproteota archaeon]